MNLLQKDTPKEEVLISVDIEADGPIPGDYSMSSLGACLVDRPEVGFYTELKPVSLAFVPEAVQISGLNRAKLIADGIDPRVAMQQLANWLHGVCGAEKKPVFVAFNATYDWMFVHWYFIHFFGCNPFGISGWDIKAYYAGVMRKRSWAETAMANLDQEFRPARSLTHNALEDARDQARIFQLIRLKANAS